MNNNTTPTFLVFQFWFKGFSNIVRFLFLSIFFNLRYYTVLAYVEF